MALSTHALRLELERGLLTPWTERTVIRGRSAGLSLIGYDITVEFDAEGRAMAQVLSPGDFKLMSSIERFQMPPYLWADVRDKSSWARLGLAVQNTVIEPGWRGHLTLEVTNHSAETVIIERGDPIAQILFHTVEGLTGGYGYEGKYQNQERGPVKAREEA